MNATTLDQLADYHAMLKPLLAFGSAGYTEAQRAVAWQAIMVTYPELLAAARIGLEVKSESLLNSGRE